MKIRNILPKLSRIERILIDIDALKPLLRSTEQLLDLYLFCSSFPFKEIRLWMGEGGLRFEQSTDVMINTSLEHLSITLAHLNNLILLFQRAPNLHKLYVQISEFSSNRSTQYVSKEIMPKKLRDFHIQTYDRKALIFDDFFTMMIHIPSIECLSLDMDTTDIDYADGFCWAFLKARLPQLKELHFKIRLWIGTGLITIDINPFLSKFPTNSITSDLLCGYESTACRHDSL